MALSSTLSPRKILFDRQEMFLILGGGFGLYGYLPALVHGCGESVMLPLKYRERLGDRDDIRSLQDRVCWVENEEEGLDRASAVVISKRPEDQSFWVDECIKRPTLADLILEKPMAPSPALALSLMHRLEQAGKNFRISYLFRTADWGRTLLEQFAQKKNCGELNIEWQFQAHHYSHNLGNWKRFARQGGGALRFYGIHLIALLAELGYSNAEHSYLTGANTEEAESWHAALSGQDLPRCCLGVDSNSVASRFMVHADSPAHPVLVDRKDPFDTSMPSVDLARFDSRLQPLTQVCRSLKEDGANYYSWYRRTLDLWEQIEQKTVHVGNNLPATAGVPSPRARCSGRNGKPLENLL